MTRRLHYLAPLFLFACSSPEVPLGDGWRKFVETPPEPIEAIDILFVIDNSGSMANDQYALVTAAGDQLFGQLEAELGGMPDLHLGVVSTDMGAGPYSITGCDTPDNGVLQSQPGEAAAAGCTGPSDAYIVDFDDGAGGRIRNYDEAQGLADTFACIARLGISGCGFEHQLEAMRRALDGSNPENAGFLRDDAFLLIVILSDEDDCSAFDPAVFDPADVDIDSPLGRLSSFRCFDFGVACDPDEPRIPGAKQDCVSREDSPFISPVAGYVDFLANLKTDPSLLMLAGIVPPPGPVEVALSDFDGAPELAAACTPPPIACPPEEPDCTQGPVQPAVRLDSIIHSFPAHYVFEPMCDDTMPNMLQRIARTAAGVMAAETCIVGEAPAADATCRAYDLAPNGARTTFPVCTGGNTTDCFTIAIDDAECGHTPSRLRVTIDRSAPPAADSRFILECL